MGQCEIVDPAACWKLILSIQPHDRPGTTPNSFGRCLKIIDTFRRLVKRADEWKGSSIRECGGVDADEPGAHAGWGLIPLGGTAGRCRRADRHLRVEAAHLQIRSALLFPGRAATRSDESQNITVAAPSDVYLSAKYCPAETVGFREVMDPAAYRLEGLDLDGGWTVGARLEPGPAATGGNFSCGYHVIGKDGKEAFLKALDFSPALRAPDPARALQSLTEAYNFERNLVGAT
jgi:hypothetical protein